ncbi:phage replisome organizer N-terminal domain-containing protein [Megasphaera elsdenii]|uniref:phage replisome organizer N-terminal domain-containing protein n=1 Tax=Megasphaera elsdenii TaxID=907 RepID=UPI00211B9DDA|nr:phage replisome organizer N-terminal domain-containing protein [Megasphaera elsdenii]
MKKLQWLKTRTGLFSDPRILCLMNQANGDSYIVLWFFLKDMAGTVNDNGLVYVSGQEAMTNAAHCQVPAPSPAVYRKRISFVRKTGAHRT